VHPPLGYAYTFMLSCTVSKISRIISQIFAVDTGWCLCMA